VKSEASLKDEWDLCGNNQGASHNGHLDFEAIIERQAHNARLMSHEKEDFRVGNNFHASTINGWHAIEKYDGVYTFTSVSQRNIVLAQIYT
jgi:hypothetical protein